MHKHRFGVPMRCHKRVYVRLARPLRRARRAEMKCRCQTGAASERTTASRSLIADHGANWGRELRALWRRSFGRRAARHDEGEIDLKPTTEPGLVKASSNTAIILTEAEITRARPLSLCKSH